MRERSRPAEIERKPSLVFPGNRRAMLVAIILGALLLSTHLIAHSSQPRVLHHAAMTGTIALNGSNVWSNDRTISLPAFDFSPPDGQTINVSPLFEQYYTGHNGATSLGAPVTVAFPTDQGWMQFFASGALLLPAAQHAKIVTVKDPLTAVINSSRVDPTTGVVPLSFLQTLLTIGSQAPIDGGPLTYVDLRRATNPALMLPAPKENDRATSSIIWNQPVFIKAGTRAGKDVGHFIPLPFWRYINLPDISPDGWQADFGTPLTEALPFNAVQNGDVHHLLVQAFEHDALLLDQDSLDASGQPQIRRLDTGVAYLRTMGIPTVAIRAQQTVWAQADTVLLDAPATDQPLAHVGESFPLMLLGDTAWQGGMLWYHVQWTQPNGNADGWIAAPAISFTLPKAIPAQASFDLLSSDLATYLAGIGDNVDAFVYDVTNNRQYGYNADMQFITGSSMKVPILLTFLNMTESQDREPDGDELNLLTTMIENSDNDSASALYYGEIGGAAGVASYMQSIGVSGLDPNGDSWGYSLITPKAMVTMLTLLYEGKILTEQDRQLALHLMENIEADQQIGVGDTAPANATVAMKDGWLPGPDGLWAFNSSGIVMLGQETYIIAVYTQEQNSLDDGHAIVQHVCGTVASILN